MTTEEARAPEPNWATYIDTLKTAGAVKRSKEAEIVAAPSAKGEGDIPDEPKNWAEFIDRIYMRELMRRLDHRGSAQVKSFAGARAGIGETSVSGSEGAVGQRP